MPGDRPDTAADAYDELATRYVEEVEEGPYNADLEFPATTALIPAVEGLCLLDAGCGAGRYTGWLLDRGAAEVVGVDASARMLATARDRLAARDRTRWTLHRADLGERLAFADSDAFDGIVCAMALDYVEDWGAAFAEFARLLTDGGFLVASVAHPVDEFAGDGDANYFETECRVKAWDVEVPYYRRPLEGMLNPLLEAGFRLETVAEPRPTERFRERWPERYETESRQPVFFAWRAVRASG